MCPEPQVADASRGHYGTAIGLFLKQRRPFVRDHQPYPSRDDEPVTQIRAPVSGGNHHHGFPLPMQMSLSRESGEVRVSARSNMR